MSNRREFSRRLKLACEPERKRVAEQLRARINYECQTRGISEAELRRELAAKSNSSGSKSALKMRRESPTATIKKFHLATLNAGSIDVTCNTQAAGGSSCHGRGDDGTTFGV